MKLVMKPKVAFYFFLIILPLLLLNACSPRIKKAISIERIIYPSPPDTARIQYLTSISNSSQITKKQSALAKTVVGENKSKLIYKPYGVFIRNGKLYVNDVSLGGGLEIIDLKKKEFEYFIPQESYKLKMPLNCYVDYNDELYIVDAELSKIAVFDESNKYITAFGMNENIKPTGIFIFGNKIYVADSENHRINVYNKNSKQLEFFFPKSEPGEESYLYKPINITIAKEKVYVSDMGGSNIKIYNLEGEFLRKVGKFGKNIGEFVRPKGIAVDRDENLYVVDASFENIQIFNNKGQLLMFFGGHYQGPGGMWLPTSVIIDYENLKYFEKYVDPKYNLEYLIIVANQFGPG